MENNTNFKKRGWWVVVGVMIVVVVAGLVMALQPKAQLNEGGDGGNETVIDGSGDDVGAGAVVKEENEVVVGDLPRVDQWGMFCGGFCWLVLLGMG